MVSENTLYKRAKQSKRLVFANAFSIAMLREDDTKIRFVRASLENVKYLLKKFIEEGKEIKSIIGHESTAKILSELLNYPVAFNREFYQMQKDDILVVFQLKERLPEGKILNKEELEKMLEEKKAEFWLVWQI